MSTEEQQEKKDSLLQVLIPTPTPTNEEAVGKAQIVQDDEMPSAPLAVSHPFFYYLRLCCLAIGYGFMLQISYMRYFIESPHQDKTPVQWNYFTTGLYTFVNFLFFCLFIQYSITSWCYCSTPCCCCCCCLGGGPCFSRFSRNKSQEDKEQRELDRKEQLRLTKEWLKKVSAFSFGLNAILFIQYFFEVYQSQVDAQSSFAFNSSAALLGLLTFILMMINLTIFFEN